MDRFFPHPWGWATLAPIACAIHCAVTPILVLTAPSLAPGESAEWVLLGLTVALAAWAIPSGLHRHARFLPGSLIVVGLVAWTLSLLHVFSPVPEEVSTIVASLTVAAGLFRNARLHCKSGVTDECAVCETSVEPEIALRQETSPSTEPAHAERHQAA